MKVLGPEEEAHHSGAGSGNGGGRQQTAHAFDHGQDAHASRLHSRLGLQGSKRGVGLLQTGNTGYLGQHQPVQTRPDHGPGILQTALGVGLNPHVSQRAPRRGLERLGHQAPSRGLLSRGKGILQIVDDHVGPQGGRLLDHAGPVARNEEP